ncbi:ataxin-1-like [Fundulus heteroclitus]|uniref:ataxin-1-like n=1 Tax=Fundulus heteroclitus TaxID=8078 RepID=UPI00165A9E7C|nr:ataxin-1-like [Fundulus heteroclitus]XP_021176602.2 ataxin-1-like [Fundulus heteroclitus]XP_021176603.2 ataxin-1-like [Fundulus heteroclitus]XP_021176604.2 ataxin-1-like [Fundulus heteroclitus]XP_035995369.1 ataxin-1-like [Fundulus heteroclitus]XP_035995379.1 ataxin-1-like [Fundulus heteroclitus]XP_035995382.1 ataxin-1-like [Fundulus heteroclitus]
MNPSPDRSKERLPPKKRESRQGSAEHHVPLDEFKPPVPFRSRHTTSRGDGGRETSDRVLSDPNPHLLHSPPPLPASTPGLHVPLPWTLNYSSPVSLPLFPGQVSERRTSGSPAWRDDPLIPHLPHHSRWLRGEGPLSLPPSPSSSSSSTFKTPFPASTREMWSYINTGRRDYSPFFSPPYLFSPSSLYHQDPSLVEVRPRYISKRPNGLDGPGSRTASSSRPLLTGEYGNDSSRSRLEVSPYTLHANGGRRQQEDLTSPVHSTRIYLSDSHPQVSPEPHSSLQETHHSGKTSATSLPTSPHTLGPDPRAGRGGLLDHVGATPTETQRHYSPGSVNHPSPHAQAYPLPSSSGTLSYSLHREPGPSQHTLRNSPHSPLSMPNSHDRSQSEWDRDLERDKVVKRDRERGKVKEKQLQHDKDQERDSERERRRNRDRGRDFSPSNPQTLSTAFHPSPSALLPHFTKGSLIELASGRLKRVEELRTEDFLRSADTSPEFHLSTCTVLMISPSSTQGFSHLQVHLTDRNSQELLQVLVEYPFFVRDQGWSSCSPQRTTQLYGLPCRQLSEGDVCLALTPMPTQTQRTPSRNSSRAHRTQPLPRCPAESSSSNREEMPPPPPPPPLPPQPPLSTVVPSCKHAADTPANEQQRPRKRRWSAPDTLPSARTDERLLDLPHGSKLMKWQ